VTQNMIDLVTFLDDFFPKSRRDELPGLAAKIRDICRNARLQPDEVVEKVMALMRDNAAKDGFRDPLFTQLVNMGLLPRPAPVEPKQGGPREFDALIARVAQAVKSAASDSTRDSTPESSRESSRDSSREHSPPGTNDLDVVINLLTALLKNMPSPDLLRLGSRVFHLCEQGLPRASFLSELEERVPNFPARFYRELTEALESRGLIPKETQPEVGAPRAEQAATKAEQAAPSQGPTAKDKASDSAANTPEVVRPASVPLQRSGTAFGGTSLLLPEMAITFARGLVIQAWVRPTSWLEDARIVELCGPAGSARIALLTTKDGRVELRWHDISGKQSSARTRGSLETGKWTHISAALIAGFVRFFIDGDEVPGTDLPAAPALPFVVSRTLNFIGESADKGVPTFSGAIADVRLWNRYDALDAIVARSLTQLRGDEAGLCGWWTLEGSSGTADSSPFGRHARRVGGQWKAGESTFEQAPLQDIWALDFAPGGGHIELSDVEVKRDGLTWEANICARGSGNMGLFSLNGSFGTAELETKSGKLSFTVTPRGRPKDAKQVSAAQPIMQDRWVNVALTWAPNGWVQLLVDGKIVGEGLTGLNTHLDIALLPGSYKGTLGEGFEGQMAEVRLWSRVLTAGEQKDRSKRRIHGWAPDLIGCWRMDDAVTTGTLANTAVRGATAQIDGKGVAPKNRRTLAIAPAPKLTLQRAARLAKKERLTLPALPDLKTAAISVQLWIRPDRLAEATVLNLPVKSSDGVGLVLKVERDGGFAVVKTDGSLTKSLDARVQQSGLGSSSQKKSELQKSLDAVSRGIENLARAVELASSVAVPSVFRAARWAHVTVTIDPQGVLCVYRNGQLAAREVGSPFKVAALAAGTIGSDDFAGMVSELRIWSRALSSREIAANWHCRVSGGAGMCGRWALATDLSGRPGAASGPANMSEAATLVLQDGLSPACATVDVCCQLLADPRGAGGKPQMVMDLTALDDKGLPKVGVDITIALDRGLQLYRSRVEPGRLLSPTTRGGTTYTVKAGPQGRARVVFEPSQLTLPLFRLRHAAMRSDEWVVKAPDAMIHEVLVSLTANELRDGRRATASTRAGGEGFVSEGHAELCKVLRGMATMAAQCTLEMETEGALAFSGGDAAATSTPLQAGPAGPQGSIYALPEGGRLVRRLTHRVATSEAPVMPESFGLFDWIKDSFDAVVEYVEDVGEDGIEVIEDVVDDVVTGIKIGVNTVIDGVSIASEWVIETVDDVIGALNDVLKQIKKTASDVLGFIAAMFDWGDFLETAELTLTTLKSALKSAKSGMQGVFDTAEAEVREAETSILKLLKGAPSITDKATTTKEAHGALDMIEMTGPLDLLLAMLPDDLESALKPLLELFDPIEDALLGAVAKISTLSTGLNKEWQSGELKSALAKPESFLDKDPGEWLNLARMLVRVVANSVVLALDLVSDLATAVLDVIGKLLDLRINIPVLTKFVEDHVLDGKSLTVGRLLCLVTAIPTTLAYKLATGSKQGPCAALDGPVSFGDAEDNQARNVAQIVVRSVSFAASLFGDVVDSVSAVAGDDSKKLPPWQVANVVVGGITTLADGYFVFADPFTSKDFQEGSGVAKAGAVIDMAGWLLGVASLVCDTVDLVVDNDAAGDAAGWLGVGSGVASFVSGVLGCIDTFIDDKHTAGAGAVAVLDTVASLGELAAGVASALPDPKETVSKAVRAGVVIGGHAVGISAGLSSLIVVYTTDQGE